MTALLPYLVLDALVLIGAVVFLASRLSFWHPATTYLLFHAYSFSVRAWQLFDGASPMYAENGAFDVIRPEEFQRALLLAEMRRYDDPWRFSDQPDDGLTPPKEEKPRIPKKPRN